MAEKIDLGTAKRFGARYGTKPKQIFAAIEKLQRTKNKCPYCHYKKVRRIAYGIWLCEKCNAKFTGRAYTISEILPTEKKRIEEAIIEDTPETQEEESYDDEDNNQADTQEKHGEDSQEENLQDDETQGGYAQEEKKEEAQY